MSSLYPPLHPFKHGHLDVGDGHQMYYEVSGNPSGKPVLFVHGGPGGGTGPDHRRYWDPDKHRIVLFDQRGCGKSTPHANLEANTTHHLIADMERLRQHLNIDTWQVFGGSWGCALSVAYAEAFPERVTELILRGIFLAQKEEVRWYYQEGASRIFPDVWEKFLAPIGADERSDMVTAYYKQLTSSDEAIRLKAAEAWSYWEVSTARLHTDPELVAKASDAKFAEAFARIECHYFIHDAWLREGQLLEEVGKIKHIPAILVQGRYDTICPPITAWRLHKAWPGSELIIVPDAGHSALEPGIEAELVKATQRFAGSSS